MVDTLGPHGYAQRMRITALACVTFALGALAGGVVTFGGLAVLGGWLGAGQGAAATLAVALLLVAAAGDAGGRRIVPQVRRQVPESWRRVLPVPVAAGLYGVLLGLGFTTFVLSFAVYALAGVCLVLGDTAAGLAVGLAFAAGRILPVVVLAPLQETARGVDIAAGMAERPGVLRTIRAAGALALGVAALVLAFAGVPANAATQSVLTDNGTDPSTIAGSIAWQLPGGGNGLVVHGAGQPLPLPGSDPALGPDALVWREGEALVVADRFTLRERLRLQAPGAEEPAISARWLAWRAREPAGDVLRAVDLRAPDRLFDIRRVGAPDRIGRPSIEGDRVVFHVGQRTGSRLEEIYLPTRRRTTLRTGRDGAQLLNPSEQDGRLLYIRSSAERQQVLLGPRRARRGDRDASLLTMHATVRRDPGHEPGRKRHDEGYPRGRAPRLPARAPQGVTITLWSTALAPDAAYVSRIRRTAAGTSNVILRLLR